MELTVTKRRENDLLDRTEVLFTVSHAGAGTPTRADIRKALAAVLNAKDGVVILDWARSEFGRTSTRGYAKVYKSKAKAMSLETPPILIRNGLLQPVAKKEAPKEAPEAAAPRAERKEPKPEAAKEAPKAEAPKKEAAAKAPPKEEPAKEPAKKEAPKPAAKDEKKEAPAKKDAKKEEAPKEKKPAKKEGK